MYLSREMTAMEGCPVPVEGWLGRWEEPLPCATLHACHENEDILYREELLSIYLAPSISTGNSRGHFTLPSECCSL